MLFEVIETFETEQFDFLALSNGTVFTGVELSLTDLETANLTSAENALSEFLKSLHPSVKARFVFQSKVGNEISKDCSRATQLSELMFVENSLKLFIEIEANKFRDLIKMLKAWKKNTPASSVGPLSDQLLKSFDLGHLENAGFRSKKLTILELKNSLIQSGTKDAARTSFGVDLGHLIVGVIRMNKQGATSTDSSLMSLLKDQLPLPFEIRTSVKRLVQEKSEIHLRRRTAQVAQTTDNVGVRKYEDSQDQLEDVALHGGCLFQFECIILIPRLSESELRKDANSILQKLKPLGDFSIETFGAGANYLASQIGYDQHVPILETDKCLPCFLPWLSNGASTVFVPPMKKRSLVVHRRDQTLFDFDLFNPAYDNFSANVIGKSGRGKSVFTNLLTRALHNDPDISMIKIDVGGSHTKETQLLGGVEKRLLLSEPSGINPFKYLSKEFPHSEDVCNVVGNFLNVLLLEEGETTLSKSIRGEIEKTVSGYSLLREEKASISGFYHFANELPRRDLLARWTDNGIYRNAFAEKAYEQSQLENRLKYFNFSQIFQANDPDFGQGGLAAVMAQFNLDLMQSKKKLVFIADETPFFIERCFSFFKFSTANVRKFGGSFITIAQKSSDLVVNGDTGIIENSSQKFIFSIDGDPEAFAARMRFDNTDLAKIDSLQNVKGKFSEVFFHDVFGSRTLRLSLTPDEYWAFTSSQDDNERINTLMENVPGLKLSQAISALAQVSR